MKRRRRRMSLEDQIDEIDNPPEPTEEELEKGAFLREGENRDRILDAGKEAADA